MANKSRLSRFLEPIAKRHGTTHDFAAAVPGLSQSTVWRLLNDRTVPDDAVLTKLATFLGEPESAELVRVFLLDRVPENLRHLVRIEANASRVREAEPLEEIFQQITPECRSAILRLASICLEDQVIEDLLISMASRLNPEPAKEPPAAP